MCQSRIEGRNGVSVCVLISALFSKMFLLEGLHASAIATDSSAVRQVLLEGNALYDQKKFTALLSANDLLNMEQGIRLERRKEMFVRPAEVPAIVRLLAASAYTLPAIVLQVFLLLRHMRLAFAVTAHIFRCLTATLMSHVVHL